MYLDSTYLVEEPAGAGITGAAIGDVGEPDGFFWSSSEDSKDVWPGYLRGRPSDNLLEVALALRNFKNFLLHTIQLKILLILLVTTFFQQRRSIIFYKGIITIIILQQEILLNFLSISSYWLLKLIFRKLHQKFKFSKEFLIYFENFNFSK